VYVIAKAQIVQQLLVGFQTPKIPPPMLMQLLKLNFFSLWEGKSPYMPLQWFGGGKYAKMDAVFTSCR
jgi:hypothetical protein